MNKYTVVSWMMLIATAMTGPVAADDKKIDHSKMGHGATEATTTTEVTTVGVINSVDTAAGKVNFTHEPIKELGWPTMTMDLAVTKSVDLSTVKPGANATFKLKLGRDKQYRITAIAPK